MYDKINISYNCLLCAVKEHEIGTTRCSVYWFWGIGEGTWMPPCKESRDYSLQWRACFSFPVLCKNNVTVCLYAIKRNTGDLIFPLFLLYFIFSGGLFGCKSTYQKQILDFVSLRLGIWLVNKWWFFFHKVMNVSATDSCVLSDNSWQWLKCVRQYSVSVQIFTVLLTAWS